MLVFLVIISIAAAEIISEDVEFLNELPLDKLLRLKTSLQDLVTTEYANVTTTTQTPSNLQRFGAEAMAIQAQPPIKRGDYEEALYKKDDKISNIFSMSVTTLAFLAFGGYLLCLIVQAVKAKQNYYNTVVPTPTQPTTFFVSAGIKKRPQSQFTSSYGRRKREVRLRRSLKMLDVPPEQLFSALLQVCEGYAKWSEPQEKTEAKGSDKL